MRSTALLVMILLRAATAITKDCNWRLPLAPGDACKFVVDKAEQCTPAALLCADDNSCATRTERRADGRLTCIVQRSRPQCNNLPPLDGFSCEQHVDNATACLGFCFKEMPPHCVPELETTDDGKLLCVVESMRIKNVDSSGEDHLRLNEYIKTRSYPTISPIIFTAEDEPYSLKTSIFFMPVAARITEVNEKEQAISVMMAVILSWNDYRLAWNSSEYGGIEHLVVTRDSVWRPPILPLGMMSFSNDDSIKPNVDVKHTGQVSDATIWNFRMAVNMQFHNFPFDRQTFHISMGVSHGLKIIGSQYIMTSTESENEWKIVEDFERLRQDDKKELTYKVTMKRYPNFWIYLIILPCFILGFLVIAALTLGADSNSIEALVNIGLAASVSSAVVVSTMTDNFPKTEKVPSLAIFVLCQFIIIVILLITLSIRKAIMHKIDSALEAWQKSDTNEEPSTMKHKTSSHCEASQEPLPSHEPLIPLRSENREKQLSSAMKMRIKLVQILKHRLFLFGLFGSIYTICFAVLMSNMDFNFEKKERPEWLYSGVNLPNFMSPNSGH